MTFTKNGHIEFQKFAETETNQHFAKMLALIGNTYKSLAKSYSKNYT